MKGKAPLVSITRTPSLCLHCALRTHCLGEGLAPTELEQLANLKARDRLVECNQPVYRMGDPFHALYAVRAGSLKSTTLTEDGQEPVLAFHFPGDLVGLDGLAQGRHDHTVFTLERSSVCVIPFSALENLSHQIPRLRHRLLQIMSQAIHREARTHTWLAQRDAEQRLAAFLVEQARWRQMKGFDGRHFLLSMTRIDISNHLGLTAETLSRTINRLQRSGLITMDGRQVQIEDLPGLLQLIGEEEMPVRKRGP